LSTRNRGQVVGQSNLTGDTTNHAFLWQNGEMTDLGTLPGDVASLATNINSKTQVVGPSFDASGNPRAFLWQDGVMTDLNTLIPADSPFFLVEALAINDRGQITGYALVKATGENHGFLATPCEGNDDRCQGGGGENTVLPTSSLLQAVPSGTLSPSPVRRVSRYGLPAFGPRN
jgi:probable HAF family extracellular repeat protein